MWESDELLPGMLQLAAWLAALGLVAGIGIWWARRRGSDTLALTITRSLAGIAIGLSLIGLIFGGINQFIAPQTWLSDHMRMWVDLHQSSLLSPTCDADGLLPDGSPGGDDALSYCRGAITHLPFAPRLALFIATLFTFVAAIAIAWSIYTAALLASRREPFHPSVHRTFALAANITLVATIAASTTTTIGTTTAARSLVWMPDVTPPFMFQLPLWPFAVAVGLFALSAIFRYGARLQNEAEQLRQETDGLI